MSTWGTALILAGTVAPICVIVVGSRWLSKFALGPVYFFDVILLLSFVSLSLALVLIRARLSKFETFFLTFAVALLLYSVGWLLVGPISREALREFAPIAYLSYSSIVMVSIAHLHAVGRQVAYRFVFGALVAHLSWVLLSEVLSILGLALSIGQFRVFEVRDDFDGMLIAVLLAQISTRLVWRDDSWLIRVVGFFCLACGGFALERLGSTGSYLAFSLAVIFSFFLELRARGWRISRTIFFARATPVLTFFLLGTYVFGGLNQLSTIDAEATGLTTEQTTNPGSGEGDFGEISTLSAPQSSTVTARLDSWETLVGWILESETRLLIGVGFGSSYLLESGALEALVGQVETAKHITTHPHNAALFLIATLGLVGLSLATIPLFLTLYLLFRFPLEEFDHRFSSLMATVVIGIGVVSSVGVVFETPFGAMLLAFSVGGVLGVFARSESGPGRSRPERALSTLPHQLTEGFEKQGRK